MTTVSISELSRREGLRSVGKGAVRIGVDVDEEAVGAGGDGRAGHGKHLVAAAGAVRWVGDDGQVG
jgi:hypothetical protein